MSLIVKTSRGKLIETGALIVEIDVVLTPDAAGALLETVLVPRYGMIAFEADVPALRVRNFDQLPRRRQKAPLKVWKS
ncbi:MAG: hypothetical protein ABIZ56_10495 [Chthoniobacteraceae bacterium]